VVNFFVSEARKSQHKFPSKEAEKEVLIYNYNPAPNSRVYYFPKYTPS